MALWVEIPLGRSRRVHQAARIAQGFAWTGAGLAGAACISGGLPALGGLVCTALLAACTAAVPAVALLRRYGVLEKIHRASGSTLCIDRNGAAFLRPRAGLAIPLDVRHAHRGLGIVWIEAIGDGHRYRLLSGLDQTDDRQWSHLGAWLAWLQRDAT